jgi:hypothetical protein
MGGIGAPVAIKNVSAELQFLAPKINLRTAVRWAARADIPNQSSLAVEAVFSVQPRNVPAISALRVLWLDDWGNSRNEQQTKRAPADASRP